MANRGQRLLAFATKNDWEPVLRELEAELLVKYVESGTFSEPVPLEHKTFEDLPRLGEATKGDAVQERRYLIMQRSAPVYLRTVHLNQGGFSYIVDHGNNPDSIIFSPGGVLGTQKAIIQGEVSKLSNGNVAKQVFLIVSKLIKKHFETRKAYRVGHEALLLSRDEFRLTASIRAPIEYDLDCSP